MVPCLQIFDQFCNAMYNLQGRLRIYLLEKLEDVSRILKVMSRFITSLIFISINLLFYYSPVYKVC